MNESTMQAIIMRYAMEEKKHEITIPNITMFYRWEADVLSITKSLLVHEFEIKIAKSDYQRDHEKKYKHYCLSTEVLASHMAPNYFWYATWGFEIEELPPYAGWVAVVPDERKWKRYAYSVVVRKAAPRLHTLKIDDGKRLKLSRWLSFKLKNMYETSYLRNAAAIGD